MIQQNCSLIRGSCKICRFHVSMDNRSSLTCVSVDDGQRSRGRASIGDGQSGRSRVPTTLGVMEAARMKSLVDVMSFCRFREPVGTRKPSTCSVAGGGQRIGFGNLRDHEQLGAEGHPLADHCFGRGGLMRRCGECGCRGAAASGPVFGDRWLLL